MPISLKLTIGFFIYLICYIASQPDIPRGDVIADLAEDLAAEEKARVTYEHLMDLTKDEKVLQVLAFLRQREIVHYDKFKELYEHYIKLGYKHKK